MKSGDRLDYSEWEDDVLFDADDIDFLSNSESNNNDLVSTITPAMRKTNSLQVLNTLLFKVPSVMSIASVPHLSELRTSLGRSNLSISSSLSDLVGSPLEISTDNVVTIEDLRAQLGSCFTCGVSWTEEHVSLDCRECGGYSMERPCPLCDGSCGIQWKRDFPMSHATGKAKWSGVCSVLNKFTENSVMSQASNLPTCGASQLLAQELCSRLEKLSAHT